jgi:hypothetical protein
MKKTHQKANDAYLLRQHDWTQQRLAFTTYEQFSSIVSVLATFSPCLLPACGTFFAENERGTAWVSAVSDTAIRLEYFEGPFQGDAEWVEASKLSWERRQLASNLRPAGKLQNEANLKHTERYSPNGSLRCPWQGPENQKSQIQEQL